MKLALRTPRGETAAAGPDEVAALVAALTALEASALRARAGGATPASRWRAAGRTYRAHDADVTERYGA